MGIPPAPIVLPPSPPPNWISRRWKLAVVLGCLALFVLLAMLVGTIFGLVEYSFQHSDAYTLALARAQANPEVIEKIGQPLKVGWLTSGNINVSGPSGEANLAIPISGQRGKGTIYIAAKKKAGIWEFETLQVEVDGVQDRIDLLREREHATEPR